MRKILSNNKGFSLIELIVVIVILGILVGVAAPNLIGYVEKTRVATDISTIDAVTRAAQVYVAENDGDSTMNSAAVTLGVAKMLGDLGEGEGEDAVEPKLPELKSKAAKKAAGEGEAIKIGYTDNVITVTPSITAVEEEAAK